MLDIFLIFLCAVLLFGGLMISYMIGYDHGTTDTYRLLSRKRRKFKYNDKKL